MSIFNETRIYKEKTREMATDFSLRKSALFMPSSSAKCVLLAKEKNMINKHTNLILPERDKNLAIKLNNTLKNTNLKYTIINTELSKVNLYEKLDYVWIDLNGTITIDIANWINNTLSFYLQPGSIVCLTHEYCWRNNLWLKKIREKEIRSFNYRKFRHDKGMYNCDRYITFPPYLMHCLLRQWKLEMLEEYKYSDRTIDRNACDMVFYRFIVKELNVPEFPSVVEGKPIVSKGVSMKNSVFTAAVVINSIYDAEISKNSAKKAHATRKLNSYVAEQVKNGKKESQVRAAIAAHVTRLRNSK